MNFLGENCGCAVTPPSPSKEEGSGELPRSTCQGTGVSVDKRAVRGIHRPLVWPHTTAPPRISEDETRAI